MFEFEVTTQRADDFEREVTSLLGAHRLRARAGRAAQPFRLRHRAMSQLALSRLGYGRAVDVDVLDARAHWALSRVTAGEVGFGSGARRVPLQAGTWVLYAPDRDDPLHYDASATVLTLAIPLPALERAGAALLGRHADAPLRLQHGVLDDEATRRTLDRLAERLWALPDRVDRAGARVALLHEELALYELAMALPSPGTSPFRDRHTVPASDTVRRARDFLHGQDSGLVGLHEVAAHAGVGVRTLCAAFRRELGVSPIRYLRELRLERARADLLAGCSVTEAATRSGFWNLGDFSRHYRALHGELPTATRRNSAKPSR